MKVPDANEVFGVDTVNGAITDAATATDSKVMSRVL